MAAETILGVNAAKGIGSGVTAVAGSVAQSALTSLIFGSFNPSYNKLNQKRMRYIQQKYAQAYGSGGAIDDFDEILKRNDPNSKLRMTEGGSRPMNPFPSEKAFEESLEVTYYPVSGHQGRFAASHALKCQGKINEYQVQRRRRLWIPGVQSAGRPNDYINLFLAEIKTWLANQMTLDAVEVDELKRRDEYYAKLKRDNYYWCFPEESGQYTLQDVIDYVHNSLLDALEIVSREEKNKSLQQMFKELNDNTNNAFEYGKNFLAHLTTASKKVGADLMSSQDFDGETFEKGKLHKMLLVVTDPIMKSYVTDMKETEKRIEDGRVGYIGQAAPQAIEGWPQDKQQQLQRLQAQYTVDVPSYVESTLGSTVFNIDIRDPKGHRWIVGKTYNDFKALHKIIAEEYESINQPLTLPPSLATKVMCTASDYEERAAKMSTYVSDTLFCLHEVSAATRKTLSKFLDTRELVVPSHAVQSIVFAENIGNPFNRLKSDFTEQLVVTGGKRRGAGAKDTDASKAASDAPLTTAIAATSSAPKSKEAGMSKDLANFKQAWGVEWVIKILDAYSLLQRMATVLSWTLEINHFFLSMFGNTLSFSKLPLKEIVVTQKEIISAFSNSCAELFKFACYLHADQQYKWHKNLQVAEHQLEMLQVHADKAINIINRIETDHLEYETQMRRLQDVASRFQPIMTRVGGSLPMIQQELGLPVRVGLLGAGGGDVSASALALPLSQQPQVGEMWPNPVVGGAGSGSPGFDQRPDRYLSLDNGLTGAVAAADAKLPATVQQSARVEVLSDDPVPAQLPVTGQCTVDRAAKSSSCSDGGGGSIAINNSASMRADTKSAVTSVGTSLALAVASGAAAKGDTGRANIIKGVRVELTLTVPNVGEKGVGLICNKNLTTVPVLIAGGSGGCPTDVTGLQIKGFEDFSEVSDDSDDVLFVPNPSKVSGARLGDVLLCLNGRIPGVGSVEDWAEALRSTRGDVFLKVARIDAAATGPGPGVGSGEVGTAKQGDATGGGGAVLAKDVRTETFAADACSSTVCVVS